MYSKLMWSGISLLLSRLKKFDDDVEPVYLEVLRSSVRDNTYSYLVELDKTQYRLEYNFTSNICVYGKLIITNLFNSSKQILTVLKKEEAIVLSLNDNAITEHYICSNGCYISLIIENDVITDVSTMEIVKSDNKPNKHILNYTTIPTSPVTEPNRTFIKTIFAASGAIDQYRVQCDSPIFVGNSCVNMTIFSVGGRRVLCLTAPSNHSKDMNIIQLLNSDFKQIIQYNRPDLDICVMEEYVLDSNNDKPALKRKYDCECNEDVSNIIVDSFRKYSITYNETNIVFTKI